MATYTFSTYTPSTKLNSMGELLGDNWNLKSYGSKTVKFTGNTKMHLQSASQVKMYKRSMFNISGKLSGVDKFFSSCYSANIFDAGITLNCEGLYMGENGDFQKTELLEPIQNQFNASIIYRIFQPHDIINTSNTYTLDEDGETTLVNTDGSKDTYRKTFLNSNKQYKIYFPRITRGGISDESVNTDNDLIDVINQSKLYSISLSCNDKTYTLNATSLT